MQKSKVFIISGNSGDGKTSLLIKLIENLKSKKLNISGFYAEGKWDNNVRSGFDLLDIKTNKRWELCTINLNDEWIKEGRFYFNPIAIDRGKLIIKKSILQKPYLIIIDEIGPFELQGKIWASSFEKLLKSTSATIIITAKQKLISQIVSKFNITDFHEILSNTKVEDFIKIIEFEKIKKSY